MAKKVAIKKVLCCFFVLVILVSLISVSVSTSDGSSDGMCDVSDSFGNDNTHEGAATCDLVGILNAATYDLSDCIYGGIARGAKEALVGENTELYFVVALTEEPCGSRVHFGDPIQWFVYKPDGTKIIGETDTLKCCIVGGPYDNAFYNFPDAGEYTIKIEFLNTCDWATWKITALEPKSDLSVVVSYPYGSAITPDTAILFNSNWIEIKRLNPTSNKYTFTDLDAGTYHAEAYKDNMFIGSVGNIKVSAGETKSVTLTTYYKRDLTITVYYSDGSTPVNGATLKVYSWDGYYKGWEYEYQGTTNSGGKVTFSSWPTSCIGEKYKITVEFGDYSETKEPISVDQSSGGNYGITTDIVAKGTLTGKVTDSSGGSISGATVTLGSWSTTTDYTGHYTFNDKPTGTYNFKVEKTGYNTYTGTATVGTGTSTKDVQLTTGPHHHRSNYLLQVTILAQ